MSQAIQLTIDEQPVIVVQGTTIWEAARQVGKDIPVLCHDIRLRPVGVCRMCVVELEGSRLLVPSCVRQCENGMVVRTKSERVERSRKMLVELLMAEHVAPCEKQRQWGNCELEALAERYGVAKPRFGIRDSGFHQQDGIGNAVSRNLESSTRRRRGVKPHPTLNVESLRAKDGSSPVIAVDHAACILCDRCIRACDEVQVNEVIGRALKGHSTRIAFDDDKPMGKSTCVSCGECASVCPTGALMDKPLTTPFHPSEVKKVDSICPYCGVGCAITYWVKEKEVELSELSELSEPSGTEGTKWTKWDGRRQVIVRVTGREDGAANLGKLCVKGRYGYDFAHHRDRLTVPLIRKPNFYPKRPLLEFTQDFEPSASSGQAPSASFGQSFLAFREAARNVDWRQAFEEASWDEALELAARKFMEVKQQHASKALAGFGSAKVTCEEAYLFQKLIRQIFGTNNVDHCARLCHASSVAALLEGIGSGAVSNPFHDVLLADVILCVGTNTTDNHPVAATFFKNATKRGTKLIVIDPRRPDLARHATCYIRHKPGTDVALFNGFIHVILKEGLHKPGFIAERTEGFEQIQDTVARYTPELVEQITGVPKETIIEVARTFGKARNAMIFWGMGISQHTHGTDNARCLIALCLITGNIGRAGTGLHPLRGQNNVQGASDVGLIPMFYSGYQPVEDTNVRAKFEQAWGVPLDGKRGLTVVEIMNAVLEGRIKAMLMMGENPFLSDPNINKVRKALAGLEFLVVQDIFLTETAEFADVVLPAAAQPEKTGIYVNTNRDVQLGRAAIPPPGQARYDWEILQELANRMLEYQSLESPISNLESLRWNYRSPTEIWEEIRQLTPIFSGVTHERLESGEKLVWPVRSLEEKGDYVIFTDQFPTPTGKAKLVASEFVPAKELPDEEYPFVLNTGRVLYHWHTGTMTRRAKALEELAPQPYVEMNPKDMEQIGISDGELVTVSSRRGNVTLPARRFERVAEGNVFIPFHFREAAANLLTIDELDPYAKIPEFKFCAVKVEKAGGSA